MWSIRRLMKWMGIKPTENPYYFEDIQRRLRQWFFNMPPMPWLFRQVWRHRWPTDHQDRPHHIIRVHGWRSGLFESYGKTRREGIAFCFKIGPVEFD